MLQTPLNPSLVLKALLLAPAAHLWRRRLARWLAAAERESERVRGQLAVVAALGIHARNLAHSEFATVFLWTPAKINSTAEDPARSLQLSPRSASKPAASLTVRIVLCIWASERTSAAAAHKMVLSWSADLPFPKFSPTRIL